MYARLAAISVGLRDFYGIGIAVLPDPNDNELSKARSRVEGALIWLRKAGNALARARMDEQECVVRMTLKSRDAATLLEDLQHGVVVPFAPDLVSNMTFVHLRGISASVEPIRVILLGGPRRDISIAAGPIRQCRTCSGSKPAGRVSSSNSLNLRDISGGRPMFNRCPIGNWTVTAQRSEAAEKINRLHLDFLIAFVSKR